MNAPTRRGFLIGATFTGGALLVGCSPAEMLSLGSKVEAGPFGPFIKIAADGAVTVMNKHIEFGQGSHAGLAAIVAEELGADWAKVKVEQAPANTKLYANALLGMQLTGGSTAVASSWEPLRKSAAAARTMLVQAAATRWNVPAGEIRIENGVLTHAASAKAAGFGELLEEAAKVTPPEAPALKDPKTFTLIGTDRVRRKDALAKATGQATFTQDVKKPNLLVAMVAHPPRFGGRAKSFDGAAARKIPGVVEVYSIPTGIAVVAQNTWAARQGRDALKITWDEAEAETRGSDQILAEYRALASGKAPPQGLKWEAFETRGTAPAAPAGEVVEVAYDFPYLAHAAMEPMNCVAEIGDGKKKLTFGSQAPSLDQLNAAKILTTLPGSIEIETLYAGGSFGRRANFPSDYMADCLHVAKKVGGGRPVKLVWTREDDMAAGHYRPLVHHRVRVSLDKDGFPASWTHRIVTQSIMKDSPMPTKGVDASSVEGVMGSPYLKAVPHVDAQVLHSDVKVPVLWWRSVGHTHTAYVMEHTLDQLARKAGKDPVEYRRALLQKAGAKRHLAVLDLALQKAGPAATAGWSRGVAVHESFGSVVAQVAEVQLKDGQPKVGRVVTAIDCGTAISPNQVASQMEGGTCYGLSAVLYGQITLTEGRVDQQNFDGYRVLRNSEAPTVETYILPQAAGAPPTGVGEPATPVIGPAVANALLALTGQPSVSLPMVKA